MNFESPQIPSDWNCLQVGSFSRTMAGGTPSTIRSDFWDGDVPWINSGALKNLEIKSPSRFITKLGLQNSAAKLVPAGSAVIALTGATTGMVGLLSFECATNQSVVAVVPNDSAISAYLFYFLMFARPHVLSFATGAAQPHINKGVVDRLLVPLPPLPEQKKIAHILTTVQRAIDEQERIIQTTTELKKALMHKLFTEGLRNEPLKQTEIGLIPESWELVDLVDVIRLFAGFAFKSQEGVKDTNTQLLRMGNLYQNTLDLDRAPIFYPDSFADTYKRFVLEEGDLVMSLTGTSGKEDYGFTVRIPETGKSLLLNQRVTRIDITDNRLQKDFAHHFLLSRKFLDFLYPTAKGMKQANLSTNAMKKLKIVLPDKQEQDEIAACFKSLDQKIVVAGRKVASLQELFRTLLHELMTAKTRVH